MEALTGMLAGLRVQTYAQMLKRPEVTVEALAPVLIEAMEAKPELAVWVVAMNSGRASHDAHLSAMEPREDGAPDLVAGGRLPAWVRNEMKTVETEIKFAGYLEQQRRSMEKLKRAEERVIPAWFDYTACSGLSREMVQTLGRVRPRTLGQASRIQGVTPAAVSLVNCFIEIQARRQMA